MMNRLFPILSILTAAIAVTAQVPADFSVKAPTWTEVAVATNNSTGARVHKLPTATSACCVFNPSNYYGEGLVTECAYWGSPVAKKIHEARFIGVTPVVAKKTGWINLYQVGPKGADGWVKAGDVTLIAKSAITPEMIAEEPTMQDFYGITVFLKYDPQEQTADIHFGRLADGVLVFPYVLPTVTFTDSDNGTCTFGENDDYYFISLTPAQKDVNGVPVMKLIPAEVIAEIADRAIPADHPLVIFGTVKGMVTTQL